MAEDKNLFSCLRGRECRPSPRDKESHCEHVPPAQGWAGGRRMSGGAPEGDPASLPTLFLGDRGVPCSPSWGLRITWKLRSPQGNQGCVIEDTLFPCPVSTYYYLSAHRVLAPVSK